MHIAEKTIPVTDLDDTTFTDSCINPSLEPSHKPAATDDAKLDVTEQFEVEETLYEKKEHTGKLSRFRARCNRGRRHVVVFFNGFGRCWGRRC